MGNRAVITTKGSRKKGVGVYLHWNGGRDSVNAFLCYCKMQGYRGPVSDCYGLARLTQTIANFFGGGLSIGIDTLDRLDCDNGDNGLYYIDDNWKVRRRRFHSGFEQNEYDLYSMCRSINDAQPDKVRLSDKDFEERFKECKGDYE